MWLRTSSASTGRVMPKVGMFGLALVAVWAIPGLTQELDGPSDADARFEGRSPIVDVGTWAPPRELAENIRTLVAKRWAHPRDSIVIEWHEPTESIDGFVEPARLLGPGRGGSWIALLEDESRRASLRFRAGVRMSTPVATRDLPRGYVLTVGDVEWQEIVFWGAPTEPDTRPREGWISRRPITAGDPLVSPQVNPRPAVASGTNVTVRWTTGRVTVELSGRAVGNAALGEEVSVRLKTGLRVRGIAIDSITVLLSETPVALPSRSARRVARARP